MYIQSKLIINLYNIPKLDILEFIYKKYKPTASDRFTITEISAENEPSIGIEKLRSIIPQTFLRRDEILFLIIFDANLLTLESQNYLLKVMEEPANNVSIFLVDSSGKLETEILKTIQSRCSIVYLPKPRQSPVNDTNYAKSIVLEQALFVDSYLQTMSNNRARALSIIKKKQEANPEIFRTLLLIDIYSN